eukprot:2609073-Rhodomonas_salina.2
MLLRWRSAATARLNGCRPALRSLSSEDSSRSRASDAEPILPRGALEPQVDLQCARPESESEQVSLGLGVTGVRARGTLAEDRSREQGRWAAWKQRSESLALVAGDLSRALVVDLSVVGTGIARRESRASVRWQQPCLRAPSRPALPLHGSASP